jgi:parvulin-like peptidyl-prolyl isomerase
MVFVGSTRLMMSLALLVGSLDVMAQNAVQSASSNVVALPPIFAKVGDVEISREEYDTAFYSATRSQFYHGKPPDGVVATLQREVGEKLVTQALLLQEAKRRGLRPDEAELKKTLNSYEQRYAKSEQWKKNREQVLPGLTARLEQDNLLMQIEQAVRAVPAPDQAQVMAYYNANPEKFTEPEQLRVAVIMLKVEPSSPKAAWDKSAEEAQELIKKLREGADFEALARARSGDPSAAKGGDMGYLHNGMLPDGAQDVVNPMKVGELSSPVRLLEGVAIFRLTDRKVSKLNSFDKVRGRAQELLTRDLGEQAWKNLLSSLKKEIPIQINQAVYLPLSTPTSGQSSPQ